jgi:uncharacterized protein YceK
MELHKHVFILIAVILLCSGCATIVRGTTEPITIECPNCPGAVCTLRNKKGVWTVTAPGSIVIPRSDDPLKVTCEKDGKVVSVSGESGVSTGAVVGDALLFGIFSAANASTDAHREYPDTIVVPIVCK